WSPSPLKRAFLCQPGGSPPGTRRPPKILTAACSSHVRAPCPALGKGPGDASSDSAVHARACSTEILLDQAAGDLGGEEYAGKAGAGMGAGADEVEAGEVARAVVWAEVGRLEQGRLDREGGAEVAPEVRREVDRGEAPLDHDARFQVVQSDLLFQCPDDPVAEHIAGVVPVDAVAQVRDRRQGVEAL